MIPNGTFTMTGPRGHRTVKVTTVKKGELAGRRIVSLMTGRDKRVELHRVRVSPE